MHSLLQEIKLGLEGLLYSLFAELRNILRFIKLKETEMNTEQEWSSSYLSFWNVLDKD